MTPRIALSTVLFVLSSLQPALARDPLHFWRHVCDKPRLPYWRELCREGGTVPINPPIAQPAAAPPGGPKAPAVRSNERPESPTTERTSTWPTTY